MSRLGAFVYVLEVLYADMNVAKVLKLVNVGLF